MMKDSARDRFPAHLSSACRIRLRARKVWRQTLTRLQERAARCRPLDPLLADGEPDSPWGQDGANPPEALTKCARWLEEDLARPDVKAIADELRVLKEDLDRRGLRYTNTAGSFLRREYGVPAEHSKAWENAWVLRHAEVRPGQRALDVGGASTLFSFYLARLGCDVAVADNDWSNCGLLENARHVARAMGWRLTALDQDATRPLPYADGSFDRVFSICVLEHLPPAVRQRLMRELGRVLAPGGIAGFTTDYDEARPVLTTDKGLRFAYRLKLERDVLRPSGLAVYGPAHWVDGCPRERFLGALFLHKPRGGSAA
jgi:SAM-dependent methyltransferase